MRKGGKKINELSFCFQKSEREMQKKNPKKSTKMKIIIKIAHTQYGDQ